MADTVAQMTKEELREMLDAIIEQKLLELLGDPDEGRQIRESLLKRLVRQKEQVAKGERGRPLQEVARELGLD